MTMIDDNVLSDLFAQAAEALPPPESGPADILEKAFGSPGSPEDGEDSDDTAEPVAALDDLTEPRGRRLARGIRTHRALSVAACVVLAFVVVGAASWLGTSRPPTQVAAGLQHSATTVPGQKLSQNGAGIATGAPAPPLSANTGAAAPSIGGGSASSAGPASPPAGSTTQATAAPLPNNAFQSAKVEQTGSLSLTVHKGSLTKTMGELGFLASAFNGFVADSQTQTGAVSANGAPSGTITLQVPVNSFSQLLKRAQGLGKTADLTTKASDVTGQYVDLQKRIDALNASRQQYLTIMAKATSVGDVLAVQSQLDTIQQQIEELQGQLNLLTSQTTYSTLTVEVTEGTPHVVPQPVAHHSGLSKAWHDSVHGFVVGVEGIIRLAGPALFVLLCGAVLAIGGRVGWRRYQRHQL
jgi:hypothetical protein